MNVKNTIADDLIAVQKADTIKANKHLLLAMRHDRIRRAYPRFIKRFLDIILSIIATPILILAVLILAPLIWCSDHGPVFYNSLRLGYLGKTFTMYKFRTMRVNAPDVRLPDGSTYNGSDDPRQTKVGAILRKLSLDELPQIINVLKGDMSFIGPRPDLPEHLRAYEGNETEKLNVRPGLTGYNQAYFRNTIQWKKRLENDVYYVNHISFPLDVKILAKTIGVVLLRRNIYINKNE